MFTGIVEHLASVALAERDLEGMRLELNTGPLSDVGVGDSIAVNGVCLTAIGVEPGRVAVQIVKESLSRSNLGGLKAGDSVNLERPMPLNGRFDGHIVQGHVDGVGQVLTVAIEGEGRRIGVEVPDALLRYMVEKGSVTVDGVSLTIASLTGNGIEIALIPHTLSESTLGLRKVGDKVNLEVDVLAKYVERLLKADR